MTAQISKSEQDERGLLPYPVIIAATKGDPEAMNIVVQHYESYIASLSMRKLRDERGNIYWGIDEDIRERHCGRWRSRTLCTRKDVPSLATL